MKKPSRHIEWLSLIEVSGPFITVSMLEKIFPQGLEAVETPRRQRLREAYEEWCDAVDEDDPQLAELHREWIRLVLMELLEYDREVLNSHNGSDETCTYRSPDHPVTFSPAYVVRGAGDENPRLLISIQPPGTDLESARFGDGWPVSLAERMVLLCRSTGVRLGLLTDGERWMLVNGPIGAPSSHASWYARLWFQEPVTLKAFQSLLGVRRCFGPAEETLDALLEESLKHHEEVTDTLGEQVRRAVEVLVQCLDKADQDRNRELLRDVSPAELYEAGLTVMMRLVFVLCAEERGLLLSGDPVYDQCYAISTLRGQLAEEADHHGPEVLDRRHDAWARLLAVFRAVYGGIEHESLRMPALGGSLFDPDRFPFLEGRLKGTRWRETAAAPLPIDNRTVLLLLSSLQILEQPGGALLLSYKALDVEQIGHVYEGLLEHTVSRVPSVTVGLIGSGKAKNPNLSLSELESAHMDGEGTLLTLLFETTKRSESAIRNALARPVEDAMFSRLLSVCGGDTNLAVRIRPYGNLIRTDAWEEPIVYRGNAFMVTLGADRRETGTHYTPKSLTESIVETTLEPVTYVGPAEGKPREEWRLKSPAELLDLKICDPAVGSGAFLVQACRWLAARLVEAWAVEEAAGKFVTTGGDVLENAGEADPMPTALDERLLTARRLISERCLYGVDVNPLAIELAKLSIWLVTLAKGRPFGFLDNNLRHGDSLLGIHRLDQLTKLRMNPDDGPPQQRIFGQNVADAVAEATAIRKRLRTIPIRDMRDVETIARLDMEARQKLEAIELVADAMIGEVLRSNGNSRAFDSALDSLAMQAGDFLNGNEKMGSVIRREAREALSVDLPKDKPPRKPFHWPLQYPEVISKGGFDAIIGNPPFMGGKKISGNMGSTYRTYLVGVIGNGVKGNADLCSYFFLASLRTLKFDSTLGMLATNTIAQGDTREVGLDQIINSRFSIIKAIPSQKWPGKANLEIAMVWIYKGIWSGLRTIDNRSVSGITPFLVDEETVTGKPFQLAENAIKAYMGQIVLGEGFILTPEGAQELIRNNPKNKEVLFEYLSGQDATSRPDQSPSRFVINFFDWPLKRDYFAKNWFGSSQAQKKAWLQAGIVPNDYPDPVAADYPDCLKIIEAKVRPQRAKSNRKVYREKWWQYAERQPKLMAALECVSRVLFHTFTGKYVTFSFAVKGIVYAGPHNVILLDQYCYFALLQSTFHSVWVREYCSTMEQRIRYATSDVFQTFPFPVNIDVCDNNGQRYYEYRLEVMTTRQQGLTNIYNCFHDIEDGSKEIQKLRELHVEMDKAVAAAYGWDDLDLQHGFHENKQGIRFTISEKARVDVLRRLIHLNHQRYEEEVSLGLHSKNSIKSSAVGRRRQSALQRTKVLGDV